MDLIRIAARVAAFPGPPVHPRIVDLWHRHVEEVGREDEQRLFAADFMELLEEKGLNQPGLQFTDLLNYIPEGYSLQEDQNGEYYVTAPEGKGPDDEETDAFTRHHQKLEEGK